MNRHSFKQEKSSEKINKDKSTILKGCCIDLFIVVRVKDLIRLPKQDFSKEIQKKRRGPVTAPDYHLTGQKSMKFIEEADIRKKENTANELKYNKIKDEAVKAAKAEERKTRSKVSL